MPPNIAEKLVYRIINHSYLWTVMSVQKRKVLEEGKGTFYSICSDSLEFYFSMAKNEADPCHFGHSPPRGLSSSPLHLILSPDLALIVTLPEVLYLSLQASSFYLLASASLHFLLPSTHRHPVLRSLNACVGCMGVWVWGGVPVWTDQAINPPWSYISSSYCSFLGSPTSQN